MDQLDIALDSGVGSIYYINQPLGPGMSTRPLTGVETVTADHLQHLNREVSQSSLDSRHGLLLVKSQFSTWLSLNLGSILNLAVHRLGFFST